MPCDGTSIGKSRRLLTCRDSGARQTGHKRIEKNEAGNLLTVEAKARSCRQPVTPEIRLMLKADNRKKAARTRRRRKHGGRKPPPPKAPNSRIHLFTRRSHPKADHQRQREEEARKTGAFYDGRSPVKYCSSARSVHNRRRMPAMMFAPPRSLQYRPPTSEAALVMIRFIAAATAVRFG